HYFAAYTCVHGHYPLLKTRLEAGAHATGEDPAVLDLLGRVHVVGHQDRPAFTPRITVRLRNGTTYQDEFQGSELEWDFAPEVQPLSRLFEALSWPRQQLDGIVQTVAHLEAETQVDRLIALCVRQ